MEKCMDIMKIFDKLDMDIKQWIIGGFEHE